MSAHTPGPWAAGTDATGKTYVFCNSKSLTEFSGAMKPADARLIAAAPDLLAALRHYVNVIAGPVAGDDKASFMAAIREADNRARAAIAKATEAA